MPIGVPLPGGIPTGGPIGGLIPGGGPIMPGGDASRPIGGGGPPRPGGYCVQAPATLAVAAVGAPSLWDGPPTPRTDPASPAGAWGMGTPAGIPLPASLPIPGPPAAPASGTRAIPVSFGGGPSTVTETSFSPRSSTRPRARFSSLSACLEFFGLIFRNSSQSQRIKFMCLSKALKGPMKIRPSLQNHLILST
uniref:Uncharacterized protein n=1 Tax=Saimiri boliviensis boliviensis TaxID=39432 RepID=A0A2K6SHL5_SAIBB